MGPETSMGVQAALGSDIALVFDECLPFHVTRDYTARSTERTHRWLDRCLAWHERARARSGRASTGSSRAAWRRTCGAGARRRSRRATRSGIAIGGTLGQDKAQMYEVVGWTTEELPEERPRHLLGIGDVDDLLRGVELGIDTFDCAMPTRIGRHGMAIVPDPERRWRVDLAKGRYREADEPLCDGLPVLRLRGGLLARLPALPVPPARDDRRADRHAAQPRLPAAADGRAARRDRRRPPGRGGRGRPRRRAAVGDAPLSALSAAAQRVLSSIRSWISSTAWSTSPSTCSLSWTPRWPVSRRPACRRRPPTARQQGDDEQRPHAPQRSAAARAAPRPRRRGGGGAGRRRRRARGGSAIGSSRRRRGGAACVRASGVVTRRALEHPRRLGVVEHAGRAGRLGGAIPRSASRQRLLHRGGVGEAVLGVALERARDDERERARDRRVDLVRAAAGRPSPAGARGRSATPPRTGAGRRAAGRRRRRARRGPTAGPAGSPRACSGER